MKKASYILTLGAIFLVFIFGIFAPNFIFKIDAYAGLEGEGTQSSPFLIKTFSDLEIMKTDINVGENNFSYYKLINNISLPEGETWSAIGKTESPFSGHFDGNGKTITGLKLVYDEFSERTNLGLFGVIQNAEIKNLSVDVSAVLIDDGNTPLHSLNIGAIAGHAINSTIYNSKVNFELKANQKEYSITTDQDIDLDSTYYTRSGSVGSYVYSVVESPALESIGSYYELLQTEKSEYLGEIVCGGAVGYGQGLKIYQCSNITKINIVQEGSNVVNSCFGGVVGQMEGGEIYFVYVAPSEKLISEIGLKSGSLANVANSAKDIILGNTKINSSVVSFGGIVGYAQGASFVAFNNVYSSMYYSNTSEKIVSGGIIGKISTNSSSHSQNITDCKYLKVNDGGYVTNFSNSIGNAGAVSYTINSSMVSFNAMPTLSFYTEGSWKALKDWDFTNVWKSSSIITYGNYLFPNLHSFSTYNIKLSNVNTVQLKSGEYSSGYLYLYFTDASGNPIYENDTQSKFDTDIDFEAGESVFIKAIFYNDSTDTSKNFQYYYDFKNWTLNDSAIISTAEGQSSLNGYSALTSEAQSEITFLASASTEGTYGVGITGEAVTIKVYLAVQDGTGEETDFGRVSQIIGNQTINHNNYFQISVDKYVSGIATVLEATNLGNSNYIFSKWVDVNSQDILQTKGIVIELDNTKSSTSSRFYPKVVYKENKLMVELICYFSNNTSELTLKISNGGKVSIDGAIETNKEIYKGIIVNNKPVTLLATTQEGYRFTGWYISDELVSAEKSYVTSINSDSLIEARFERISATGGGLNGWIIALIVIGGLGIIGLIVFIVIKTRGNSFKDYKKHFKY